MNSRRIVILIVAILLGALSAFGLSQYVSGLEDEANAGQELQSVWVVTAPIPKGTPIEQVLNQGLIAQEEIPAIYRPASAISDPAVELDGLVAVVDLPVRSFVISGTFVEPNVVQTGITDRLEENGMHTVTFSVDQLRGVAGFVQPGDFVNILSIRPLAFPDATSEGGEDGEAEGGNDTSPGLLELYERLGIPTTQEESLFLNSARYVYQKAEILSIGNTLTSDLGASADEEGAAAPVVSGAITLAVPPESVQTILSIAPEEIYLSLVPPTYQPVELDPIDYSVDEFPAEIPEELTPYGPDGAANDPSRELDESEDAPAAPTAPTAPPTEDTESEDGGEAQG